MMDLSTICRNCTCSLGYHGCRDNRCYNKDGYMLDTFFSPAEVTPPAPFDPWAGDFVHSEEAKPFICRVAEHLSLKLKSVHDDVTKDDDIWRRMYAQLAVRLMAENSLLRAKTEDVQILDMERTTV